MADEAEELFTYYNNTLAKAKEAILDGDLETAEELIEPLSKDNACEVCTSEFEPVLKDLQEVKTKCPLNKTENSSDCLNQVQRTVDRVEELMEIFNPKAL